MKIKLLIISLSLLTIAYLVSVILLKIMGVL